MSAQFKSVSDFLAMGGDAGYVFGAWGLSLVVIGTLIILAVLKGKQQRARLKALEDEIKS